MAVGGVGRMGESGWYRGSARSRGEASKPTLTIAEQATRLKGADTMTNKPTDGPLAHTDLGDYLGVATDGIARFAGIRYAEPPVGDLRWRPTVAVAPHDSTFDATSFGPIAPQNPSLLDSIFGNETREMDEDCLSLNVWTPAFEGNRVSDASLPVMVWVHGGGFEIGAGSQTMYDGAAFATSGVVFVSINYRLGAFGFMELGGLSDEYVGSGNNGLRDQLCALEWVHSHIANFGGDPDNVTVFGQSAGAMSISLLLSTGRLRGLVRRAICQSGAASTAGAADVAHQSTMAVAGHAGLATMEDFTNAPVAELLAAHGAVSAARMADPEATLSETAEIAGFLLFRPVTDGDFLPVDPVAAVADGSAMGIELIVGYTLDEWTLFGLMDPSGSSEEALRDRLHLLHAQADKVFDTYTREHPEAPVRDLATAMMTDLVFRCPAHDLADAQVANGPVHMYRFSWATPAMGGILKATHGVELPFLFQQLDSPGGVMFLGEDAPQDLADLLHDAWVQFARDGSLPALGGTAWPQYHPDAVEVADLDAEVRVLLDPFAATRQLWRHSSTHGGQEIPAAAVAE